MGLGDLKVTPFGLHKNKNGSWIRIGGVRTLNIYVDHHFNWFQKRMIKWCKLKLLTHFREKKRWNYIAV